MRTGPRLEGFVLVLAVLTLALAAPAYGQGKGSVELGLDGRVAFQLFDDEFQGFPVSLDDAFLLDLPVRQFRAGFYVGERLELEPSMSLSLVSIGGDTAHQIGLALGLLHHFSVDPGRASPFVRAGGGLISVDDGNDSATQFHGEGGVGVKLPAGDRWAVRLLGSVQRNFSNDDFLGSWEIAFLGGFSFFTR